MSPEIIVEHPHPIAVAGTAYRAYVFGVQRADGTWAGWIELEPEGGGRRLRTAQETSQPDREALAYWASGLEDVYFDGAVARATPVTA